MNLIAAQRVCDPQVDTTIEWKEEPDGHWSALLVCRTKGLVTRRVTIPGSIYRFAGTKEYPAGKYELHIREPHYYDIYDSLFAAQRVHLCIMRLDY